MRNTSLEKKHILVICGEPITLAEIKKVLMSDFDVGIASCAAIASTSLHMQKASAIVIYIGENSENAFEDYTDISPIAKAEGIPILFLAERDNEDDEAAALSAGAEDYVVRRRNSSQSLIKRLKLRICAGEYDKHRIHDEVPDNPERFLAGKTILVVDDIKLNRDMLDAMLCDIEGLSLEFAVNGKQAVDMFDNAPELFSLILMDIHMPEMDGLEATRTIRKLNHKNSRMVPIIALTAAAEKTDKCQYLEAGMDDTLEKPIDVEKLMSIAAVYC
jgi:CheY-like chemotaxis protein